jgi:hypothetical protein
MSFIISLCPSFFCLILWVHYKEEEVLSEQEWQRLQAEIEEGAKYWAERDRQIAQEWLPLEEELWQRR